jgi:hypothetical protein
MFECYALKCDFACDRLFGVCPGWVNIGNITYSCMSCMLVNRLSYGLFELREHSRQAS